MRQKVSLIPDVAALMRLIGLHLNPRMPYPRGWPEVVVTGIDRCSEFVCQSCQKLLLCAVFANRANLKINNLCGLRGLRTNEFLFLRHVFLCLDKILGD